MIQMIRAHVSQIGITKIAFLVFISLLFAASGRDNHLSYELFLVSSFSDHYFVLYCVLPLILVCLFPIINDDSEMFISRFPRYSAYFLKKWISFGFVAALLITAELVGVFLSGIGLECSSSWAFYSSIANNELFAVLMRSFGSPVSCFAALITWQWVGIWLISGFMAWARHFIGVKGTLAITIIIFLISALSIKISLLAKIPLPTFNYLLLLHHNMFSEHRIYVTLFGVLLIAVVMIITIRYYPFSTANPKLHKGMMGYYMREIMTWKNIGIMFAVIGLLSIYKYIQIGKVQFDQMWVLEFFSGHGIGYLNPILFMEMLVLNGTPIYLLASFTQNALKEQTAFVPIRVRTKQRLMCTHLCIGGLFVAVYCGILFLVPLGQYLFLTHGEGVRVLGLSAILCFLKVLDCFVQYLLFLIIYCFSQSTVAAFITIIAGNILAALPKQLSTWLPMGISSSARFFEERGIYRAIGTRMILLLGIAFVLTVYLLKFCKEKIAQ